MNRPGRLVWLLVVGVVASSALVRADTGDAGAHEDDPDTHLIPSAAPQSYKAGLSATSVGLAEPFFYDIEVRHEGAESYDLPARFDLGKFGLRDKKKTVTGADQKVTRFRLELQAFDVGDLELPSIRLIADTAAGVRTLELPAQQVRVSGIIDDRQVAPSLKEDTRPLPVRFVRRWWPLAVVAGVVLVGALAWWLWKRSKRPKPVPPPPPRPPAYDEALARLRALEAEALLAKGQVQVHFFRLSEIARDYLGRRFAFDALELTTAELLEKLRNPVPHGLDPEALRTLLDTCDFAKFAKASPTDLEARTAFELARRLVEQTRPPAVVEPAATGVPR